MVSKAKPKAKPAPKVVKKKTVKDFAEKVAEKLSPPEEITNGTDVVVTVTVAEPVVVEPVAEVAEPEPDFPLSPEDMVRYAWHNVKGANDPEFGECAATFQNDLRYHADSVLKGNVPLSGDSVLARFEQELQSIRKGK